MKETCNKEIDKLLEERVEEIVAYMANALESYKTFGRGGNEASSQAILRMAERDSANAR